MQQQKQSRNPSLPILLLVWQCTHARTPNRVFCTRIHSQVPPGSKELHHEVELGVVIGKAGRNIAAADAQLHIAGETPCACTAARDVCLALSAHSHHARALHQHHPDLLTLPAPPPSNPPFHILPPVSHYTATTPYPCYSFQPSFPWDQWIWQPHLRLGHELTSCHCRAGYALALDMTARDIQAAAKRKGNPWSVAKGYDTFCPVSRFVGLDEVPDPSNIR